MSHHTKTFVNKIIFITHNFFLVLLRDICKLCFSLDAISRIFDFCDMCRSRVRCCPPDAEYMANVTCYICGKKGHTRGQCPNKPTWKFIAPINGAPTTITNTDKTWYWCAKCVRWTTSHSTSTHVTKVKDSADSVKAEAKLASVSEQNQEEVMSDEDDDLIYNGFGMMAHCDDSYITWTPSSNHNNQDLINDKSNQNEHHLVDMKESDILIDTTMSEHLTLDTTAKDAETTPSKVFPVPLVTSCVQLSKLTNPLAASTCH